MAEPTDPNPGDPAKPPTESNAPSIDTSQSAAHPGQPFEENAEPPSNSDQHPAPVSELPVEVAHADLSTNQPTDASSMNAETGQSRDTPNVTPSIESSLPPMDPTIPNLDGSDSFDDTGLPSFDSALPSVGSSAAPDLSLPAIDTTLPSLDASLPAIGTDIPTMDEHHTFDDSHFDQHDHTTETPTDHHHDIAQHPESGNGSNHYQTPSNGTYQYTQSPGSQQQYDGQQPSQAQSQHQFQSQPQQNYQQQNHDMYHNQGGFSTVNGNPGNNGQGQHGQVPQAPIGSPMPSNVPPMAPMGQYMTGYPSNVPQSGMNSNQIGYPMPGDPNKILSGGRHKKEVKRRTKTGCLTCRKRRIKVCDVVEFLHVPKVARCARARRFGGFRGAQSLACARRPRHRLFYLPLNPRPHPLCAPIASGPVF